MAFATIDPWSSLVSVSAADFNAQVKNNIDELVDNLPTRATLWHDESTVTAGNALAVTLDATQNYGLWVEQSADADADAFTQTLVLAAGTYTMYILGKTGANNGKIDWDLSGTTIASGQDWYAGAAVKNTITTVAAIVISAANAGRQVLTGTVNGQNGASGGYEIELTKIWFKQASDA